MQTFMLKSTTMLIWNLVNSGYATQKIATHSLSNFLRLIIYIKFAILLADELIELLQSRHGQDGAYIGCMKSGEVVAEE